MRGQYTIDVHNNRARFKITLNRNVTILKGDSATGKSTLYNMISQYEMNGRSSGITLSCLCPCIVVDKTNWRSKIQEASDSIIFIEEGQDFVEDQSFSKYVKGSSNYFVIITRNRLPYLTYSVDEVYGLKNTTKTKYKNYTIYHTQLNKIYTSHIPGKIEIPECVIVEDSNSGYEFFSSVFEVYGVPCVSAGGNSNIYNTIMQRDEKNILVIADGAAFGQEIERVKYLGKCKNITLYLPESFEWLILKSKLFRKGEVRDILSSPYDYIESAEYYTWERFFTDLLIQEADRIVYLNYRKASLNQRYLDDVNRQVIIEEMPEIVNNAEKANLNSKSSLH